LRDNHGMDNDIESESTFKIQYKVHDKIEDRKNDEEEYSRSRLPKDDRLINKSRNDKNNKSIFSNNFNNKLKNEC